jgi:hypothetical protein
MARADLSAMLGRLDEEPSSTEVAQNNELLRDATEKTGKRGSPERAASPQASSTKSEPAKFNKAAPEPLYRRLERKETRLRSDQYARLTEEARRLSRAKESGGDRITENTLIRVAIDLLLAQSDRLTGSTELDLLKSVT